MAVWRIAIDENGDNSSYRELKTRSVVAIGWNALGDFTKFIGASRASIENHAQNVGDKVYAATPRDPNYWWFGTPPHYDPPYRGHRSHIGRIFDYFVNQIKPKDLVLAHVGKPVVGIAEVCNSSKYFYDSSYEYANCRSSIKWVDLSTAGIYASDCRFLGICKLGDNETKQVINDWNNYKLKSGFIPC